MGTIFVAPKDSVHHFVTASDMGIEKEIQEYFTFFVPGYKYMAKFKSGIWDGKIRLFSRQKHTFYAGLLPKLKKFAEQRGYTIQIDKAVEEYFTPSDVEIQSFIDYINKFLPGFKVADHQKNALTEASKTGRLTILSPTGSGKSLIIYMLAQWFDVKTLIIVPRTALIHQLEGDFKDYGFEDEVHKIYSGQEKNTDKKITISTWQSLQSIRKLPREWYNQFDAVIVDEVHNAKAKEFVGILEKMQDVSVRIGLTGTLDDIEVNELQIQGLLGPVYRAAWTHELISLSALSEMEMRMIVLHYSDDIKRALRGATYQDEIEYIITNENRNQFIVNLANELPGNTLILYRFVEKHGKELYKLFLETNDPDKVFHVYGGVDAKLRDDIRKRVEHLDNVKLVGSIQTFGEGVNIKKLDNIILASPSKAKVKNLQAIGRVLRKYGTSKARVFDLADNLQLEGEKPNHTLRHFKYRVKIYSEEKFNFKIHNITLKGDKNG